MQIAAGIVVGLVVIAVAMFGAVAADAHYPDSKPRRRTK